MNQTTADRRRTSRYPFGAVAELTEVQSGKRLVAQTADLSRLGCFIKTPNPLSTGARVNVDITYNQVALSVKGVVAHAASNKGMGIAFTLSSESEQIIRNWLTPLVPR